MKVRDVQRLMERWAPRELAWERDNVGLQVGSPEHRVKKILVTLDVTDDSVQEAKRKRVDLIISHHPLLFHPVRSVVTHERTGRLVTMLCSAEIALYSAHTNLDFTRGGVSIVLANVLGLKDVRVLLQHDGHLRKIAVFVPTDHAVSLMQAMSAAGAGMIGNYDMCSFMGEGTGTFRGLSGSNPFIGAPGRFEGVRETRLEMVAASWRVEEVVKAMRRVHPYEEVAYDVYPLSNRARDLGMGAIGRLPKAMTLTALLNHVSRRLTAPVLRYGGRTGGRMKTVAVCGGSGSDILEAAIAQGAEAFVTADVRYHTFQTADDRIAIIDAGHFETETPVVPHIAEYLTEQLRGMKKQVSVLTASQAVNPIRYHTS